MMAVQALSVSVGARHVWVVAGAAPVSMQHMLAVQPATLASVKLLSGGSVCLKRLQQVHTAAPSS